MGIALICTAPAFAGKSERATRWLFKANGFVGIGFLIGNALGVFMANILASFVWGVLLPVAAVLLAKKFRKSTDLVSSIRK